MVSIFNYGFPEAAQAFSSAGITLQSLTDYETLVQLAIEKKIIDEDQYKSLLNWRNNPSEWGK